MTKQPFEVLKSSIADFLMREFECEEELDFSDLANVVVTEEDVGMDEDFDPEAFHIKIMLDLSNPNRCYWRFLVDDKVKLVQEAGDYLQLANEFDCLDYEDLFSLTYDLYDNKWGDFYDEVSIILARQFKLHASVAARTAVCEYLKQDYIDCGFCLEETPIVDGIKRLLRSDPQLFKSPENKRL